MNTVSSDDRRLLSLTIIIYASQEEKCNGTIQDQRLVYEMTQLSASLELQLNWAKSISMKCLNKQDQPILPFESDKILNPCNNLTSFTTDNPLLTVQQ